MKIGLVSDTHVPQAGVLPGEVLKVFSGVDFIIHAGDVYDARVLDELETVAPVVAACGNGDVGLIHDTRVRGVQLIHLQGFRIGVIHCLAYPQIPLEVTFGETVDVVVYGDTHIPEIETRDGVLFVNPGSPTLPNYVGGRLGTVGFLHVKNGTPRASLVHLA